MFRESKALRIKRQIRPKQIEEEKRIFFKKIFRENTKARYRETKKGKIWRELAWVKLSGYGILKTTNTKIPQKIKAGITFKNKAMS